MTDRIEEKALEESVDALYESMDREEAGIKAQMECFMANLMEIMDKTKAKLIQMVERILAEMRKLLGLEEEQQKPIDDQPKQQQPIDDQPNSSSPKENKLSPGPVSRSSSCSSSATSHDHSASTKDLDEKWAIEITLSDIEIQCKYIIIDEKTYGTHIKCFLDTNEVEALSRLEEVKMILFHQESKTTYEMNLVRLESAVIGEDMYILVPWIGKYDDDLFEDLGLHEGDKLGFDMLSKHFHFDVIYRNRQNN